MYNSKMDRQDVKNRIEKLRQEINRYRYAYHVLDKSLISDAALDSLKKNCLIWRRVIRNLSLRIRRPKESRANR